MWYTINVCLPFFFSNLPPGEVNKIIGKGKPIYGGIDYRHNESMELYADINKAKILLDWEPKFDFKKTIKKVITWYYEN